MNCNPSICFLIISIFVKWKYNFKLQTCCHFFQNHFWITIKLSEISFKEVDVLIIYCTYMTWHDTTWHEMTSHDMTCYVLAFEFSYEKRTNKHEDTKSDMIFWHLMTLRNLRQSTISIHYVQSWTKIVGTRVHNYALFRYSIPLPHPPLNVALLWTQWANCLPYVV